MYGHFSDDEFGALLWTTHTGMHPRVQGPANNAPASTVRRMHTYRGSNKKQGKLSYKTMRPRYGRRQ